MPRSGALLLFLRRRGATGRRDSGIASHISERPRGWEGWGHPIRPRAPLGTTLVTNACLANVCLHTWADSLLLHIILILIISIIILVFVVVVFITAIFFFCFLFFFAFYISSPSSSPSLLRGISRMYRRASAASIYKRVSLRRPILLLVGAVVGPVGRGGGYLFTSVRVPFLYGEFQEI
jgi:hypothetical protein